MKIHRDGRIFITDYKRGLLLLDPACGRVSPFLETVGSESFKGLNDLVFARSGTLYLTDQGQTGMHDPTGRVYRLTPDGRLTCLIDHDPEPERHRGRSAGDRPPGSGDAGEPDLARAASRE